MAVRCLRRLEILVVKLLLCLFLHGWVNGIGEYQYNFFINDISVADLSK